MKKKLLAVILTLILALVLTACDSADYKKATQLFTEGNFEEAEALFMELGDYEDSAQMVKKCQYQQALALHEQEKYSDAIKLLEKLGDYEDSAALAQDAKLKYLDMLLGSSSYAKALPIMEELIAAGLYKEDFNTLSWCKVAAFLQREGSFKYTREVPLYTVDVTASLNDDKDGVRFLASFYFNGFEKLKYHLSLTLKMDDSSARAYMSSSSGKAKDKALGFMDMPTYRIGQQIELDNEDYPADEGLMEAWMRAIATTVTKMDIGVSIQDLGFAKLDAS